MNIFGRKMLCKERVVVNQTDETTSRVVVWWVNIGVFVFEITEGSEVRANLDCGTWNSTVVVSSSYAAKLWLESEAKRVAREMMEIASAPG